MLDPKAGTHPKDVPAGLPLLKGFFYLLSRTKRDLSCVSASRERERFELSTCLCRSPAEEDGVKHLPSSWSPGPALRALSPAAAGRPVSAAAWERASCCRGGWTTVGAAGHELCSLGCARSVTRRSVLDGLSIKIHREGQKRHVRMSKALLLWYQVCLLIYNSLKWLDWKQITCHYFLFIFILILNFWNKEHWLLETFIF